MFKRLIARLASVLPLSRGSELSEIWEPNDEGWFDLQFSITDHVREQGSLSVIARGLFHGETVGLRVRFEDAMKPGIVGGELQRSGFTGQGITFSSIGPESDRLLSAIAHLYGVEGTRLQHVDEVSVTSFALAGNPSNLEREAVKFKVFFNDGEDEDQYAELYTNIDLPERRLELCEKDEEYRANVIKALSASKPRVAMTDVEREFIAKEGELLRSLDELVDLLHRYGERGWARHFENAAQDLRAAIASGATPEEKATLGHNMRSVFGGMGSFNDLVIHPANGHKIAEADLSPVNERIYALGGRVYELSYIFQEARYR